MTPAEERIARHSRLSALRRIVRVERRLKAYDDPEPVALDHEERIEDVEQRLTDVEGRVDTLTKAVK